MLFRSVRIIAMESTDGLTRGLEVLDTGRPISVPVGKETLRRVFNVLGDTIDLDRPLAYGTKEEQIFLGREITRHRDYSEETSRRIDAVVKQIILCQRKGDAAFDRTPRRTECHSRSNLLLS